MSKYQDWINKQSESFKREILGNKEAGEYFKDYNYKPISLQELKELDARHCLGSEAPEGK